MDHNAIRDLIQATLNILPPVKFTQLAQKYRDYHVFPTMFKGSGDSMQIQTKGGTAIHFDILVKPSGNAKNTEMYEPDTTSASDGLQRGTAPWRFTTSSYMFEDHEVAMNAHSRNELINLVKVRKEQNMIDLANLLEENFFGKPADSSDTKTPWGLFYWLVKSSAANSATSGCGFNGGAPDGFTDVGGVNPSTYPQWKNYVAPYYSVSPWSNSGTIVKGDFIPKIRRAIRRVNWKSPLGSAEMGKDFGLKYKLFTNDELISQIEEELESHNDLLFKADIVPLFGKTTFKGFPFFAIDILNNDSSNPLYGVNTDTFTMYFLNGFKMREDGVRDAPNQHNVSVVFTDNTYNWVCHNRRANFVMNKVDTYAA